jgi:hypothetical protein
LLGPAAFGQWPRYIHALKSYNDPPDSPPTHPLAYFRADPRSRPNSDVLCAALELCIPSATQGPPPTQSELEERARTHTDLRLVGTLGGLSVYELDYFLAGGDGSLDLRSVLVETVPDQFHEIHVQEKTSPLSTVYPSEIVGREPVRVLKTKYDDGGNYHFVHEDYFTISKRGAHLIDFKPIYEAAEKAVPGDMAIYQPTEAFDFGKLLWTAQTEKRDANIGPKVACCEGRVSVTFRVDGGIVVPGAAKYEPYEKSAPQ